MRVTLNIEDDEQLRAAVKEMLQGQVKSIVRDELREMINSIATRRAGKYVEDEYVRQVVDKTIFDAVRELLNVNPYHNSDVIMNLTRQEVAKWVNERLKNGMIP